MSVYVLVGWYVFSAVVSGMPEPVSNNNVMYVWGWHTLHILAGDLSALIGARKGTQNG